MDKHNDYVHKSYQKELEDLNKCLEDDKTSLNTELLKGKDLSARIDVLIAEEAEIDSNIDSLNVPVPPNLDDIDIRELTEMETKLREKEETIREFVLQRKNTAAINLRDRETETANIMRDYEDRITEKKAALIALEDQHINLERKITEKKAKRAELIDVIKKEEAEIEALQKKLNEESTASEAKPSGILKISSAQKRSAPNPEMGSTPKAVKFKPSPEFVDSSDGSVESVSHTH